MRVLIIGCGYLGRRAAAAWTARGDRVSALTRSAENAVFLRQAGIEPVIGDVLAPETLRELPAADAVLYAVGFDPRAGASKRSVYVDGLDNLCRQIARRAGRFIYVSSTSVYGQDAGERVDERSPTAPASEDGRICLAAEGVVRRHFPGSSSILRFSGIYGPGRLLRRIESLRSGEPIRANPDGFLNLVHVDDGARIAVEAARRQLEETLLVTDDMPVRRRAYYELLADLCTAPRPVFEISPGEELRLGKRCANARLRAAFGGVFEFPTFESGLRHAYQ